MTSRAALLLLVVALFVAACGGDTSVGSDDLLSGDGSVEGPRLGETTTTTTAPPAETTTTAPQTQQTAAPTTAAPTTQPPKQVAIEIRVQPDASGNQFEPRIARVFSGSLIRFTNTDSVPRSVEADGGAFNSGTIAPGASWDYEANTPGNFNYTDGTRPYAVGTLEVVAS